MCTCSDLVTGSLGTLEICLPGHTVPFAVPNSVEAFLGHLQTTLELCSSRDVLLVGMQKLIGDLFYSGLT